MSEVAAPPIPTPVQQIPGSIVKAVVTVQAGIASVAKEGKNPHGGYSFASTDGVYAMVTHKMAEAGLAIICLEDMVPEIMRVEKDGKTSQWGKFSFSFILATEQATWQDPRSRRSLFIQITGPQTFMAAQSYAEKTYLRSLFKMPTGDHDLDALPQAETEEDQVALTTKKPKSAYRARKDGTDAKFKDIEKEIRGAKTHEDLDAVRDKYAQEIADMPPGWREQVLEKYEYRSEQLAIEIDPREFDRPEAAE